MNDEAKKKLYDEYSKAEDIQRALQEKEAKKISISCASEPQDEIDLHGCKMQEAIAEIDKFVRDSTREGKKVVRIITGRGNHSADGSVLMPAAEQKLFELKDCGRVVSFREIENGGGFDVCLI